MFFALQDAQQHTTLFVAPFAALIRFAYWQPLARALLHSPAVNQHAEQHLNALAAFDVATAVQLAANRLWEAFVALLERLEISTHLLRHPLL